MGNIFLISDTHFGHEKTCTTFHGPDGKYLRPFANAEEMDEAMVARWNDVVRSPSDKVYHLGDVTIKKKFLPILDRLNGKKRLIRGNHDIFDTKEYAKYFGEIYGVRVLDDMILSHIPLALECITERFHANVHGHTHANVMKNYRYVSVCVEQTNYAPQPIEVVRRRIKDRCIEAFDIGGM